MLKLPPWSFSMLESFASCPKKTFHRYILKEKAPETEAQRKGNEFDKAMESRLKNGVVLPDEYKQYEPYAASFTRTKGAKLSTQLKLGITRDFKPCAFFADDVWGRGVLDVAVLNYPAAIIADWKTGKNNEDKPWYDGGLQRKIFTLLTFKHFPKVEKITAFNIWLKDNTLGKPLAYTRDDQATLWREVLPKILKMEDAFKKQDWPACAGPLCQFCPVVTCNQHPSKGSV